MITASPAGARWRLSTVTDLAGQCLLQD